MSTNKNDYKVVEVITGYTAMYVVKKRFLWFFWKTIKNHEGIAMMYSTKRGAQAYINFLK